MNQHQRSRQDVWVRATLWTTGLLVALGAAAATAHGLYEVAAASGVPAGALSALYPLITDGLAVLAYAATARLSGHGRTYAWCVVVLAAGLSGMAQAAYLANGVPTSGGNAVPGALAAGVGAWPAIAAAIVAHLLFLIATADSPTPVEEPAGDAAAEAPTVVFDRPGIHPPPASGVHPPPASPGVQPARVQDAAGAASGVQRQGVQPVRPEPFSPARSAGVQGGPSRSEAPARDAAEHAARAHHAAHGAWPTVSHLVETAGVSRGTAHTALQALRNTTSPLHLVTNQPTEGEATTQQEATS